MSGSRLAAPAGRRIERSRSIAFEFNGKAFSGFAGDTLASALLANGLQLVGRSFKLHRPRGIFSCGVEEPTGLVDVGCGAHRTPNLRATLVELYEGLTAESVNCWPSVEFDVGAINDAFSSLLPAGFYYKTFMWPDWHLFEPGIRRMAGLGRASGVPDPDRYEEIAANADVLVVGSGIAGLAAAASAADAGACTFLIAGGDHLGGALGYGDDDRIAALAARVEAAGVRVMKNTLAFGVYDHGLLCALERLPGYREGRIARGGVLRERLWKIRARSIVAACGAFERPMIFPNNDRPGVMLARAADKYAHAFGVACGRRAVIAANSDAAYGVAQSLRAAGVEIAAIVDIRPAPDIAAETRDFRVLTNARIVAVEGARAVHGCRIAGADNGPAAPERLDCDLILSAGGFAPAVHLHSQAGGKLRWLDESSMFVPDGQASGIVSVGACA
jgi:sarcosine oxidase, subunit alpha